MQLINSINKTCSNNNVGTNAVCLWVQYKLIQGETLQELSFVNLWQILYIALVSFIVNYEHVIIYWKRKTICGFKFTLYKKFFYETNSRALSDKKGKN